MKDGSRWWYRYSDGTYPSSTRLTIDGADYAFDAQGWMVTGWDSTDGQWRYYGSSGAAGSGWRRSCAVISATLMAAWTGRVAQAHRAARRRMKWERVMCVSPGDY